MDFITGEAPDTANPSLSEGVTGGAAPSTGSPDIIRSLPIEKYLDYLAVRLVHPRAAGQDIRLNFVMPDADQPFSLRVANGVMNYTMGAQDDAAGATVTLDRATLDRINLQQQSFPDAIAAGDVTIDGDQAQLMALLGLLDSFGFWFDIVTD